MIIHSRQVYAKQIEAFEDTFEKPRKAKLIGQKCFLVGTKCDKLGQRTSLFLCRESREQQGPYSGHSAAWTTSSAATCISRQS